MATGPEEHRILRRHRQSARVSWSTEQVCDTCWWDYNGIRIPVRLNEEVREITDCAICGTKTDSGIYMRLETKED